MLTEDVLLTASADGDAFAGSGVPPITGSADAITIEGGDFTIRRSAGAADLFRLFTVGSDGDLTLSQVTLSGGLVADPGADSIGGAILNSGTLTIVGSTISGNTASAVDPYPYAYGGGIYNLGTATITDSVVSGNRAEVLYPSGETSSNAGGGGVSSCALLCDGLSPSLTITGSTISGNTAEVVTTDPYVSPRSYGGGLHATAGDVIVSNSTFSANLAAVSGDLGPAALGGAIQISDADVILRSTTISSNFVDAAGGFESTAGIEYFGFAGGSVGIYFSAIGNHPGAANCYGIYPSADGGGNLSDDGSCGSIPGSLTGLDAALKDNGGPTATHALLVASSAVDAAGDCGLGIDQRGVARPLGLCDSGAFERGPCRAANGESFVIPDGTVVADEQTFEACETIVLADTDVVGSGHLVLRTGGGVEIGNGFVVADPGARLTVELDTGLVAPGL